jgi:hypothetical protein
MAGPITLTTQASFTAAPTKAQAATFAGNYKIIKDLPRRTQLTFLVNALIFRSAIGTGFQYSSKHAQLVTDSGFFTIGDSMLDPIASQAAVWQAVAIQQYGINSDVQAQLNTIADLSQFSEDQLWRMAALLVATVGQ